MEELRKRLKEEYFKGMKVDLSDDKIRLFANNVWQRFTSDYDYFIAMPFSPAADLTDIEHILRRPKQGYKLISPDTIKTSNAGEIGFVVNIDWSDADKVYLPDDLLKLRYFKATPEIREVYSINSGEGELSSSYARAKTVAEILDVPFRSYDKCEYNPVYEIEQDTLVKEIICTYLLRTTGQMDIQRRDELVSKYGNYILRKYYVAKKEKDFDSEKLLLELESYINSHENIKTLF